MIEETLYATLQQHIETFKDQVDPSFTSLPVCRFYLNQILPSNTGDDRPQNKSFIYSIDVFTEKQDTNLLSTIENALFSTDLTIVLNQINQTKEEDAIRTTFYISIEE